MSLDEFLGDDSLVDSVWNEDEINLDAISNTTNIDILKNSYSRESHHQNGSTNNDYHNDYYNNGPNNGSTYYNNNNSSNSNNHRNNYGSSYGSRNNHYNEYGDDYSNSGSSARYSNYGDSHSYPVHESNGPYIIKFTNLPPRFADRDIIELFQGKFTKFVKFKLCWELNRHPTINQIKSGNIFEQNFKRENKVAFVEVYTSRDSNKIIKYWKRPLKEIYEIDIEIAEFNDFKEYMSKFDLLTDPMDDPSKPYTAPKPKSNPFGKAKPVDTQSKILDIEEKMEKFHVEDTETLRKLTLQETPSSSFLKDKVKLEQTPIVKEKPLSYSQVLERSVNNESMKSDDNLINSEKTTNTKIDNTKYENNDDRNSKKQSNSTKDITNQNSEKIKYDENDTSGLSSMIKDVENENVVNKQDNLTEEEISEKEQNDLLRNSNDNKLDDDQKNFQFKNSDKTLTNITGENNESYQKDSHYTSNRRGGYSNSYNYRGNRDGYNSRRGNFRGRGNSYQGGYNPNYRRTNNNYKNNSENGDSTNNNNSIDNNENDNNDGKETNTFNDEGNVNNDNKDSTNGSATYNINENYELNDNNRNTYNKNYTKNHNRDYNNNYNSRHYNNSSGYNNNYKKHYNRNYDSNNTNNQKPEEESLFKPASGFLYNKHDDGTVNNKNTSGPNKNQNSHRGRYTTRRGRGGSSRGGSRYNN